MSDIPAKPKDTDYGAKKKEIIQTKHVRFDETKLGYDKTEDTTSQVSFKFPYAEHSEREDEPNDELVDIQQRKDDKNNKEKFVRTDPKQTRSKSTLQCNTEDSDEESSNEYETPTDIKSKKIVGVTSGETERQTPGRPKKKI